MAFVRDFKLDNKTWLKSFTDQVNQPYYLESSRYYDVPVVINYF